MSVELAEPDFRAESLPFEAGGNESDTCRRVVAGTEVEFGVVSLGNPHAVIDVDSVDSAAVGILGAALSTHRDSPRGVNVGFLQIDSPDSVHLRVFERGVGETRACGTLSVTWPGPGARLWQTGEATSVY